MTIALVTGQTAYTGDPSGVLTRTVTLPNNPTPGNFVVIVGAGGNASLPTVAAHDSAGTPNNFTNVTNSPVLGNTQVACILTLINVPVGATKTLTITTSNSMTGDWWAAEFSGVLTVSPSDATPVTASPASSSSYTTPSITTVSDGDLLIGVAGSGGDIGSPGASNGVGAPWTGFSATGSTNGSGAEYFIQSAHGAQAVAFTLSVNGAGEGIIAAFKAAPSGGGASAGKRPYNIFRPGQGPRHGLSTRRSTFIPTAAVPFGQDDWPNPVQPPQIDQTWVWRQTGMLGQDRLPNRQQDWPNPTPPPAPGQTWPWRQTGMLGQDKLPFRQQDWPNPTQPPLPGPTWNWRQTGMFGQDVLPFRQQDWPNPTQPPAPGPTWTWRQTGMAGQDVLPFRQQDWKNPGQPPSFDRTWASGFSNVLRGTVTVVYPFNQYDWPNPVRPPYFDPFWFGQGIMTIPLASPFVQTDWSLPIQPPRIDQTWAWSQTRMLGQDRLPNRQQYWPNPTQPWRLDETWAWTQTRMFGQDVLPFRQQDWQNPGQPPLFDRTWVSGFSGLLRGVVVSYPFNQYNWPNPTRPPYFDPFWFGQGIMTSPPASPFVQTDWPLPALHFLPRIDPTFISGFTVVLEGSIIQPHPPFTNRDWPNPLGHQMLFQPDRGFVTPPGINILPPPPPAPPGTAVYSKQFFSMMGSMMGIPGDPPS